MREYQGITQYAAISNSQLTSPQQERVGVGRNNSVATTEHTSYCIAPAEQACLQEQSTAPEKQLEERRASHIDDDAVPLALKPSNANPDAVLFHRAKTFAGQTGSCDNNASPAIVKSSGQTFELMQLPDFIKFRDFAESQDTKWTTVYKGWNNLHVQTRPEELKPGETATGFDIVRSTIDWNDVDPETLFNCLHDAEYRATWDEKMIAGHNICQLDQHNDIGYYAMKPHWAVTNRDFCNMRSWMEFTNGDYIIMNHSVEHPECPPRPGFVRARSILTGYYIKPMPSAGTRLIFISHSDPKGIIPAFLVNNIIGSLTPAVLARLHECTLKYVSWSARKYTPDEKHHWRTPKVAWDGSQSPA